MDSGVANTGNLPDINALWRFAKPTSNRLKLGALLCANPVMQKSNHLNSILINMKIGLFAGPLGIQYGIEPAKKMVTQAVKRGVKVAAGIAEMLPFEENLFDYALMVTTICFLDNAQQSVDEAHRVIKPGGSLIIGMVDKNSPIGKLYQKYKHANVFYRVAEFFSVDEVSGLLKQAHFGRLRYSQTIFHMLDEIKESEDIKKGYGKGSFVVVSGIKK